jgi:hygromycin-B 7''-O-kinase
VRFLPEIASAEAYRQVREQHEVFAAAAAEIAKRHRLAGAVRRYPDGSLPVFAVGDEHVVKLFPPIFRRNQENERDALAFLAGNLTVPTPALRAGGELDGWPYLVMGQLAGRSLVGVWPALPHSERLRLAGEVGSMIAELRALPLSPLPHARVDWGAFIAGRRAMCVEHQTARGADPKWLALIPDFLNGLELPAGDPVFLHTEIMPDHIVIDGDGRLAGLLDFEPSMIGAAEYELAAVGIFFAAGDRAVLRAVLAALGVAAPDEALGRRLLAYSLLHKYSSLRWYLERMPPAAGVNTFEALAAQWFDLVTP